MESTLSLSLSEIQARIGEFMGWGRGANYGDQSWTSDQQFNLDGITASGLRRFYRAYDWSFLKPVASLQLNSGSNTLLLPDDFGQQEGQITMQQVGATGNMFWPVDFVGVGQVYQKQTQLPTTSGRPIMACVEPVPVNSGPRTATQAGQRFQMRFWPLADTNYTIQFAYYVNGDMLTIANPYPLGGAQHAETILEACLSVAEKRLDDSATVHAQDFEDELAKSIQIDGRAKPQTLGPNIDRSDMLYGTRAWPWNHYQDRIAVNGTTY